MGPPSPLSLAAPLHSNLSQRINLVKDPSDDHPDQDPRDDDLGYDYYYPDDDLSNNYDNPGDNDLYNSQSSGDDGDMEYDKHL